MEKITRNAKHIACNIKEKIKFLFFAINSTHYIENTLSKEVYVTRYEKPYDKILNSYKEKISDLKDFNKELVFLKQHKVEELNEKWFRDILIFFVGIFIGDLSIFKESISVFVYLIIFIFYIIVKGFYFSYTKGSNPEKSRVDFRIHILEQNKDLILNKHIKTWDEL